MITVTQYKRTEHVRNIPHKKKTESLPQIHIDKNKVADHTKKRKLRLMNPPRD
jgi:hypothetical protein